MKKRSIPLAIILSIVTFGIYGIYWFVVLTNDSNAISSKGKTASGGVAFLFNILTLGIYGIYWAYKLGEKLEESAVAYLILELFGLGIIVEILAQSKLNRVIEQAQQAE